MKQTLQDAKRLIAASSLDGMRQLGGGVSQNCSQVRYNIAAQAALADAEAHMTPEQRELIASFIDGVEESETRSHYTLRVRLTDSERDSLERQAYAAEMGLSEYVREKLGL